jgi:branched-chain amino acid transport system substrate-binding protein
MVRALEAAGKDLTPESFKAGMESLKYRDEIADTDVSFSATDHQGADAIIISVIKDANWKELVRK